MLFRYERLAGERPVKLMPLVERTEEEQFSPRKSGLASMPRMKS